MHPAHCTPGPASSQTLARRIPPRDAILLTALVLGLPAAPSRADEPRPELEAGARVRVLAVAPAKNWLVGRVSAVSADTLYFAPEETPAATIPVALAEPAQIELSAARHNSMGRGLVLGGLIGGAFGGLIVAGNQLGNEVQEGLVAAYTGVAPPHRTASLTPLFVGIASGCALGGAIGASTSVERWVPAKLPVHLAVGGSVDAAGRMRLGVTFSP